MDFFHSRDNVWKSGVGDPRDTNAMLLTEIKELRTEADMAYRDVTLGWIVLCRDLS